MHFHLLKTCFTFSTCSLSVNPPSNPAIWALGTYSQFIENPTILLQSLFTNNYHVINSKLIDSGAAQHVKVAMATQQANNNWAWSSSTH